jgi:hypothetical protein
VADSYTGQYLAELLGRRAALPALKAKPKAKAKPEARSSQAAEA